MTDSLAEVAIADREVLVSGLDPRDQTRIRAFPGGAVRWSTTTAPGEGAAVNSLDASPIRSAATLIRTRSEDELPAAGALLLAPPGGAFSVAEEASPVTRTGFFPALVQVDGSTLAVTALRGDFGAARTTVRPAEGEPVTLDPGLFEPRIAGELIAFAPVASSDAPPRRIRVLNWRTGVVLYESDMGAGVAELDLLPDGTVVAALEATDDDRIVVVAPGAPRPRVLVRGGSYDRPRWASPSQIIVRSDRESFRRLVVIDVRTLSRRGLGPPTSADVTPFDVEGGEVAWVGGDCLLRAGLETSPTPEIPPGPCHRVDFVIHEYFQHLDRRGRVTSLVRCVVGPPRGCRGTLSARLQTTGRRLGSVRFSVARGREQRVRVPLDAADRRALRRVWRREHDVAFVNLVGSVRDPQGRRVLQHADAVVASRGTPGF